ncbi:MAG TPA: hypothetical protein VHV55_17745 [Pirellulales bacterium]|jgi:hypothetical protein|nr:hypothetical protein [Pirellulales bacterium]
MFDLLAGGGPMSRVDLSSGQTHGDSQAAAPVTALASAATGDATPSIFPLPLAPLETLMLVDDRPAYPMTFFGELQFSGIISQPGLEAALEVAVGRHPLLAASIDESVRTPRWIAARQPLPRVDFQADCDPSTAFDQTYPRPAKPIDLRTGTGVRLWVRTGSNSSRMLLELHHACCDGKGGMRFLGDLLAAYAAQVAPGSAPQLDRLDPELLRLRGMFQPRPPASPSLGGQSSKPRWLLRLQEAAGFHFCHPQPLAASRPPGASPVNADFPGIQTHYCDLETSAAIQAAVLRSGARLNDVGLALLFRVLTAWQAERLPGGRVGDMRILMPADLREGRDARLPAANRMSLCFIMRRADQCRSWPELLAGIQRETRYIKQTRLGLDLLGGIGLVSKSPAALKLAMKFPRCQATAVLTNISNPTRALRYPFPRDEGRLVIGNLTLEHMTGTPPLRAGTRAGFGIGTYAGRIVLTLKCDPWLFTAEETRTLLGRYLAAWQEFAAGADCI